MEDIRKKVLDKALAMLTATGCKFAVIDPDGNKHGELEVIEPKKRTKSDVSYKGFYEPILATIQPGEKIHEITPPEGVDIGKFRGALCGGCSRMWGTDTYSTQIKDGKILLMRWS